MSSFPVPVSPRIATDDSLFAISMMVSNRSIIEADRPMISSGPAQHRGDFIAKVLSFFQESFVFKQLGHKKSQPFRIKGFDQKVVGA